MMKIWMILAVFCVVFAGEVTGQTDWEKRCEESPKTVLQEAEAMYAKAVKEKKSGQMLQALILQLRCKTQIDGGMLPAFIGELEQITAECKNVADRSVLHSILADAYYTYYQEESYRINQRTPLVSEIPKDMEEWSGNVFIDKIFTHALLAIEPAEVLQGVDLKQYGEIVIDGKDSPLLRPTLYDFLCYRSMSLIKLREIERFFPQVPFRDAGILEELHYFVGLSVPNLPYNIESQTLQIYQNVLKFRQNNANESALLMADIGRLDYANGLLNDDSVYLVRLQELRRKFEHLPYSVEVMSREARMYMALAEQNISKGEKLAYKERALQLCEEGMKRFPAYSRITLLKQLKEELKMPLLTVKSPGSAYPGMPLNVWIESQNTKSVKVELLRIEESTFGYYNLLNANKPIRKETVWTKEVKTATGLVGDDTLIAVPMATAGLYELRVTKENKETRSSMLICSSLHVAMQAMPDLTARIVVRDKVSGKPVKGAKIQLYTVTRAREYVVLGGSLTTDANGISTHKGRQYTNVYVDVTNAQNPNGERLSLYYNLQRERSNGSADVTLFTDRKVYRPGQTVYYSGIGWQATGDSALCVSGRKYNVAFYNANGQSIGVQKAVSNEWGSFSGSFVIPREVLNGMFWLRCGNENVYVQVAEYKRPKFEILFSPMKEAYCFGSEITVKGEVKNYSGIFPENSKVTYQVILHSMRSWRVPNEVVTKGFTETGRNGEFTIRFTAKVPKAERGMSGGYFYEVKAMVTDSKGESQEETMRMSVNKAPYELLILLPKEVNKDDKAVYRVKAMNSAGYELSEEIRYTISQLAPLRKLGDVYDADSAVVVKEMVQGSINSSKDSICPEFRNWSSGAYLLVLEGKGANGVKVTDKRIFYLYSPTDKVVPLKTYDWFVCEKTTCKPGESTEILFGTAATEVYALYEIQVNGKVAEQRLLKLSDEMVRINVPYKKEYGEYICVQLSFVKDQQFFSHSVTIQRERPDRKLTFQTKVFRDKLQPGQQETWEFAIRTPGNQAADAEVLAAMYDESLDQICPNEWVFAPVYTPFVECTPWSTQHPSNDYMSFNSYRPGLSVTPLQFDRLNLYNYRETGIYTRMKTASYGADFGSATQEVMMSGNAQMKDGEMGESKVVAAPQSAEKSEVSMRQNFNETAFFYPQLKTGEGGIVKIAFQVPEATTRWKFMALAHTKEMQYGTYISRVTTIKELQVAPNMPRFFRSGDHNVLKTTVSNLSDTVQKGIAVLELFSPLSEEVLVKREVAFELEKQHTETVDFSFDVPQDIDVVGCRISAASGTFSDGEQHLVAVAPDRIMVTETLPIYAATPGEHTFKMTDNHSVSKQDYRLTLELTANPIWYAVFALPMLTEVPNNDIFGIASAYYVNTVAAGIARANPTIIKAIQTWNTSHDKQTLMSKLEQNEELKSVLIAMSPWVTEAKNETEQIQSLAQLFDANRLVYLQQNAVEKLQEEQNNDGSWSWFKGMTGNRFMTAQVVNLMIRASLSGQYQGGEAEKMMQLKALRFLDNEIKRDFERQPKDINGGQLFYLYVRSLFLDVPLGDALEAHKYFMAQAEKEWLSRSLYERAMIASTLSRYGKQETAQRIVRSLREFATITPGMGMFWANQERHSASGNAITTQTMMMEAFRETKAPITDIDLMKQWLLRQKQTQNWGSTPGTVDAVYALLLTGTSQLDMKEHLTVAVGNQQVDAPEINAILGYRKKVWSADEMPKGAQTVKVTKEQQTATWGGLYLQYFDKLSQIRKNQSEGLNIEKRLFVEQNGAAGKELVPLNKGKVRVGDKVIVRLTVKLDRNMEYLHIKDLRAACFEPMNQASGYKWNGGTGYYEDIKDVATNFFFDNIQKGTYVFEYPVWVNQAGRYMDGIATIQSVYAPEFSSHSVAEWVEAE